MKTKEQVKEDIRSLFINVKHEASIVDAFQTYLEQTTVDLELENKNLRTKLELTKYENRHI